MVIFIYYNNTVFNNTTIERDFIKRRVSNYKCFSHRFTKGTQERGDGWWELTFNDKSMSEENLSHTDRKRSRELCLQRRLDRVSIEHIKVLSNKLKACDGGC